MWSSPDNITTISVVAIHSWPIILFVLISDWLVQWLNWQKP
jgi:hypothetical protein